MTQLALDLTDQPKAPKRGALRSFHANASTSVEEAKAGEARAKGQEARVLFWMEDRCRWTPSQLHDALGGESGFGPLTSLRRALTNLTKAKLLVHHKGDHRPGPYGSPETTWSRA